jgi:hypothetical protein
MKKIRWYHIVIGGLILALILNECGHKSSEKAWQESQNSLDNYHRQEDSSYFVGKYIEVNDVKDQVQNNVVSIDDIDALKDEFGNDLRNINAILKAELHSMISGNLGYLLDTMYLSADTSLYIHRDSVLKHFVPKNSTASHSELWYDIDVTLADSLRIDSLKVRDKIDVILAYKRPKWWKAKEPIVRVQSYNPYTTIGSVNNLVVKDERSKFVKVLTSKPMMFLYGGLTGYTVGRLQGK